MFHAKKTKITFIEIKQGDWILQGPRLGFFEHELINGCFGAPCSSKNTSTQESPMLRYDDEDRFGIQKASTPVGVPNHEASSLDFSFSWSLDRKYSVSLVLSTSSSIGHSTFT